jgi:hypothetical protein
VSSVICPSCGQPAAETNTSIGVRHDCCGLHSWGGKPLVNQATHYARQEAHRYFDKLWHYGSMSRSEAYRKLAAAMGMRPRDCHISRMDEAQALSVKDFVKIISGTNNSQSEGKSHDTSSRSDARHHLD